MKLQNSYKSPVKNWMVLGNTKSIDNTEHDAMPNIRPIMLFCQFFSKYLLCRSHFIYKVNTLLLLFLLIIGMMPHNGYLFI